MKKLLILALFVQGICNAPVFGMVPEIILEELYSFMPLDDMEDTEEGERPKTNRFHAFVDGHQLFVMSDAREPIYIEIVSKKGGQVVAAGEFVGDSVITIPNSGAYTIQIYSGNTIYAGEFVIE